MRSADSGGLSMQVGMNSLAPEQGTLGFGIASFGALVSLVFCLVYAVKLPAIRERDLFYDVYFYGWPVKPLAVHAWPWLGYRLGQWQMPLLLAFLVFSPALVRGSGLSVRL